MKKYFFKDSAGQQLGPFNLDELKDKSIAADTPVWHEGLDGWTTAGQVEELKELLLPPVVDAPPPVEETKTEASVTVAPASAVAAAVTTAKPLAKKGKPWVTWVLSLAAIAGTGFFIYQDMEKNKKSSPSSEMTKTESVSDTTIKSNVDPGNNTDSLNMTVTDSASTDPSEPPLAVTTVTTSADQAKTKEAEDNKRKAAELVKKKAEEDKKKQIAAEAKKKEDEKKKQLAAKAQAEKEKEMRNNWPRYVTIGSYDIQGDDQVKPFTIPVHNGYPVSIDRVTLRVDYLKKEKVVGTETLTLSNISSKGSQTVQAAGNKKGKRANVYITGITSRQLHLCYPINSGNMADPYYCN